MAKRQLSEQRQRFVEEYLIDLNGTQAAIRAGYSVKTAQEQSSRLLSNVMVQEAISKAMAARSKRTGVNQDRVVLELAKIAFVKMTDVVDSNGRIREDATDDDLSCIESIKYKESDITEGEISVLASDDGINAAGGNDSSGFEGPGGDQFAATEGAYINIAGGTLHINASGDGVDSNGDITVSGGETYVSGPTNDGNGTLDYNGSATVTGGIFAASGSSGMTENFDSSST